MRFELFLLYFLCSNSFELNFLLNKSIYECCLFEFPNELEFLEKLAFGIAVFDHF